MRMQCGLEMAFADSEIRHARWHGDDLHVAFSAAAATRHVPGEAPVTGFLQGVTVVLYRCTPVVMDTVAGRLHSGCLRGAGQSRRLRIAVPSLWQQPCALELEPAQAGLVVLSAQSVECRWDAGGVFHESLLC